MSKKHKPIKIVRFNPPLRDPAQIEFIWAALENGPCLGDPDDDLLPRVYTEYNEFDRHSWIYESEAQSEMIEWIDAIVSEGGIVRIEIMK